MDTPTILATIGAAHAAGSIETYYDHGCTYPSVNVKRYVWANDIPWNELRYEFPNVDVIRQWLEDCNGNQGATGATLADEYLSTAWQWACESAWDDAQEACDDVLADAFRNGKVYSAGRSGGHLIVDNIGTPDEWVGQTCHHIDTGDESCYDWDCEGYDVPDVARVAAWLEFTAQIEAIRDDIAYRTGWNICGNIHEGIMDAMAEAL